MKINHELCHHSLYLTTVFIFLCVHKVFWPPKVPSSVMVSQPGNFWRLSCPSIPFVFQTADNHFPSGQTKTQKRLKSCKRFKEIRMKSEVLRILWDEIISLWSVFFPLEAVKQYSAHDQQNIFFPCLSLNVAAVNSSPCHLLLLLQQLEGQQGQVEQPLANGKPDIPERL